MPIARSCPLSPNTISVLALLLNLAAAALFLFGHFLLPVAIIAIAGLADGMVAQFGPTSGTQLLLFGFEAVIIGGLGSLWGTLAGGCILGLAQTVGAQFDPTIGVLCAHLVFLAVLAVRPSGLMPATADA